MQEYSKTVKTLLKSKSFADIKASKNKSLQKELKSSTYPRDRTRDLAHAERLPYHYAKRYYVSATHNLYNYKADYSKLQKANSKG